MSNAVWSAQKALAAGLTAVGVKTFPALPEKAVAPLRYVLLNNLSTGQTFGAFTATFQVLCVTRIGPNAVEAESVLDLATAVTLALPDGFSPGVPVIGQPGEFSLNGQPHLAVPVAVTTRITRADMEE